MVITVGSALRMAGKMTQPMSLKQVLSLYRSILRTVREVPGEANRKELREWIRAEFRSNMHVIDENSVKVLLQHGKIFREELRGSLVMSR